jgi:hypothetical protein
VTKTAERRQLLKEALISAAERTIPTLPIRALEQRFLRDAGAKTRVESTAADRQSRVV